MSGQEEVTEETLHDGDARWETGQIPLSVRGEVLGRDLSTCRFCGGYAEHPALHHIRFRSQGGTNHPSNLITLHWMYEPRCHERIHSRSRLWTPLAQLAVATPGITMLQLQRWQKTRSPR